VCDGLSRASRRIPSCDGDEFATAKPAAFSAAAPGRTAYGEQFAPAAYALAAITGNVGIKRRQLGVSNGAAGARITSLLGLQSYRRPGLSSPMLADLLTRGKSGG